MKSLEVLNKVLSHASSNSFEGYSKHDALNARWLEIIAGHTYFTRLLAIQLVMRCPLHIRPLIGVKKARNCKGLSLFSRALLSRYRLGKDEADAQKARDILDWLIENPSPGDFKGLRWGYPYPWQDVGFFAPRDFPNRVVTSFVTNALLDAYETLEDPKYLKAAEQAVEFLLKSPKTLFEDENHRCLSYVPHEQINWIVMDVSVLVGAVAARLAKHKSDPAMMKEAGRLVRYVVSKQTGYGAWFYSEPPKDSHITHDNYHTGFISDAILAYNQASGSDEFTAAYQTGLDYYEKHLFEANGAPRFMNNKKYPFDIHGCAQGIISFSLAHAATGQGKEMAGRVLNWSLENMYDPKTGWFYYQQRHTIRTKIRLLRWCQAWMAYAMSYFLEHCGESS
jgi:hypothetical protein